MPYVTPPTFSAGGTVTAADLNILSDDIEDLNSRVEGVVASACQVTRGTNQSIPNNTWTAVTFTVEAIDIGGYYPGSGATCTVPSSAIPSGSTSILLVFNAAATFASNGTGVRGVRVTVNGSNIGGQNVGAISGDTTTVPLTGEFAQVVSGDDIQLEVFQNSGSSLNCTVARLQFFRHGVAS